MSDFVLIGLDGGASKISGWEVKFDPQRSTFYLGDQNFMKEYSKYPEFCIDFNCEPLAIQIAQSVNIIRLNAQELAQGDVYMQACADVILSFCNKNKGKKIIAGIGMPGLKNNSKSGIIALNNGPRMPNYLSKMKDKLSIADNEIVLAPCGLGSDADYCGIGEEYADSGKFKEIENAVYIGGGTGIADAIKIKSDLIKYDDINHWMLKTWEMKSDLGFSLEKCISAGGFQFLYSYYSNIPISSLIKEEIYAETILKRAISGEKFAFKVIEKISELIAKLIYEKITTIFFGWQGIFSFTNQERRPLIKDHEFRNTLFDKIVIGQRLGKLVEISKDTGILYSQIIDFLSGMFSRIDNKDFKHHYCEDGIFKKDILCISTLREAPALGAAIEAFKAMNWTLDSKYSI